MRGSLSRLQRQGILDAVLHFGTDDEIRSRSVADAESYREARTERAIAVGKAGECAPEKAEIAMKGVPRYYLEDR